MNRVCLIIHDLALPDQATPAASQHAWRLGEALRARESQVVLVHIGSRSQADTQPLRQAAAQCGIHYRHLGDGPAAFDVPVFPSAESLRQAHHVAAILRQLQPAACLFLDRPAAAAIAITARRTGIDFSSTRMVVVLHGARELQRRHEEEFPVGDRESIVREYLERRAAAAADDVIAIQEAELAFARDAHWTFRTPPHVLPWLAPDQDAHPIQGWSVRAAPLPTLHPPPELPRVSVCVPYYDQPEFLLDALAQLAAQNPAPHEVIVVDDGSRRPESQAAIEAARRRHPGSNWKFFHQANAGPAAARNRAAREATGDCLLFCDADNRFRPEMLATLGSALVATGADCVTCGFRTFRDATDPAASDPGYVFMPVGACTELALLENVLGDTNFLIRRDLFMGLGGFPEENRAASEDWQFLLGLVRKGHRLESVPSILFEYRLAPGSHARRHREFTSASAALSHALAAAEPAWRRLWPHAAGAIRHPRIPQLEHDLATTQAAARELARRRKWEVLLEQSIRRREREQYAANQRADRTRLADLRDLAARLQQQLTETGNRAREQEDRIRRMQRSWSWQFTAPFRALRRATLDRFRTPVPVAPPRPPLPSDLRFSLDVPSCWEAAPAVGTLRGWCLFEEGKPALDVRVAINGRELAGKIGLPREDVTRAHELAASAVPCGFEFPYRLPVDLQHQVRVEAQAPDGRWHLLREAPLFTSSRPRDIRDYSAWVEVFGTLTAEKAATLKARLAALRPEQRRLISVLMPVYNAPERWLARAIDSVLEQVYDNWELCIADDASTARHVRPVLERYAARDPRIRVVFRPENGHLSRASNSALEIVRGEFVALLDHDDELAPDALAEIALHLAAHPEADLVFTDEDKIDEEGRRSVPYFKPDYLPELLVGQNCLSHLSVYRTSLVRQVGGFRPGFEGSQDWDLALRVVDQSAPERIQHVPKVLYHWRAIAGSTALAVSEKDYSLTAAKKALHEHFARRGLEVDIRPVPGSHWQIVYPLPQPPPRVAIVMPTRNRAELVRTAVASVLARSSYPNFEIVVVNNRSDEPDALALFEELRREDNVRVLDYDAPFNYSALNNFAVRQVQAEVVVLLNNDVEVLTGRWLEELVSHAIRPEIGAVGAMLYYPDNTIQHAGIVLGLGGVANHAFVNSPHGDPGQMNRARLAQNYSAVTAACLAVRRAVFEEVGGFNETDLAIAFNDVDLCLKIRAAGYRNVWTPFAELYHFESASRGKEDSPEKQARFAREVEYMRRTWGPQLDHDPAYNVNLALSVTGWDLAWPPRE